MVRIRAWGIVFAVAAAIPSPATAARWERVDQFNWVDMDSVQRIAGGLVTYRAFHGTDAPVGDVGSPWGVHCADKRWYWMEGGQLVPVPDEPDLEPYVSESDPLFVKLCR